MDLLTRLKNKKILLIDDDEWIRDSMGAFFESEGCFFRAVETAEAGMAALQDQPYDIIISDYRLPGMDGMGFFRRIRSAHAGAIKILVTAYGDDQLVEEAAAVGVSDYIRKPFDMQDLENSLARLMGGGGTLRE